MPKSLLAAATLAVAAFAFPAIAAPAPSLTGLKAEQAAPVQVRWHGHHGFRTGVFIGAPIVTYGYYDGGCRWLRHRAVVTGSSYWWRRYRACRHGW